MFAVFGIDFSAYMAPIGLALLVVAYVAIVVAGWGLTLFGLPGNWLILVAAIGFDFLIESPSRMEITMPLIVGLGVLAVVGELIEFLAGSLGVAKKGGSRLSAILAFIGSAIGGIAGAVVGIPIPIVGSVIGVILFASIGALVGALIGEDIQGRDFRESFGVGMAAFWGRLLGSVAKTMVGGVMAAVAVVGLMV